MSFTHSCAERMSGDLGIYVKSIIALQDDSGGCAVSNSTVVKVSQFTASHIFEV